MKSICVYAGSALGNKPEFTEKAIELGHAIADKNFSMVYGLEAITVQENISSNLVDWEPSNQSIDVSNEAVIWATDGIDDNSVAFAARLLEQDVQVRIIDKEASLSGYNLSRGSVAVISMDNPNISNLNEIVSKVAS